MSLQADAAAAQEIPVFVDATAVAGIAHNYQGGDAFVVGGGAAAFECSGDALPDLAIAGAEVPLVLYVNAGAPGGPPAFEPATDRLGDEITRATGVYPLDADADGEVDLFVLRFGRNLLLRGLGDCWFEDATDTFGLPQIEDWSTAFAATWEDGATLPTLFVGNYVARDRPLKREGNCQPSYLLRPEGNRYGPPVNLGKGACTLSAMFVDWSGTGRRDLRLANDREYYDRGQSEQLFRLTAEGVLEFAKADGWDDVSLWGMGLAAHDLDGDTRPEIVVTSMADNRIERARGTANPAFDNIARELGATAQRPYVGPDVRPSTAWHTEFGDANNDGRADLLIIKGNVDQMPRMAHFDPDNLLMATTDGFRNVGYEAGLAVDTKGRGAVFADLNLDGALDILTVNRNQPVRLFAGRLLGTWLAVDLVGHAPNVAGVGARVEVRTGNATQSRVRQVGGGHAGGQLLPLHFGLGDAMDAEVRVIWSDGRPSDWHRLDAGEVHVLTQQP